MLQRLRYFWEDFYPLVILIVVSVIIMCCSVIGVITYIGWQCRGYQQATGKQTKMVADTCYVNHNGVWYAWEEYRYRVRIVNEGN